MNPPAARVRTRFAPSPTGFLHTGGARTALFNWLFARRYGGDFILRVEDTDAARNSEEGLAVILDSLRWLGLEWDEGPGRDGPHSPYYQSQRRDIYDRYLGRLQASGHVYEDDGAIRFRVPDREIAVDDLVCGRISANLREQGSRRWDAEARREIETNPDLVIRRPDGSYIFHFVNVVDDLEMGVTHVIRGEDHLSNTPKHVALFDALKAPLPVYAHVPLYLNADGSKMSKRDQGALIHEYIEAGFVPDAVNNYMALLGWSPKDDREIFTLAELVERFDLDGINRSNSKFDYEKCVWVNGEHLRRLDPAAYQAATAPYLKQAGIPADDPRVPAVLALLRDRAQTLGQIPALLAPILADTVKFDPAALAKLASRTDLDAVRDALIGKLEALPEWNAEAIKEALHEAAGALDAKMGAIMLPCRVAITGDTSGPDLAPTLEIIGRETVLQRLREFSLPVSAA
ncbi:MAG: glutamate--tRNA ligase [Akkermansiaceae bacterium]|nr:glutamate--tRNA ligase [Akkermansiaceae bacterium]